MTAMRLLTILLLAVASYGQAPPQSATATQVPTVEDFKKRIASFPPDEQVYELWRFWLTGQPPDVQRLFDKDDTKPKGFELYRKQLQSEGDPAPESSGRSELSTRMASVGKSSVGTEC